MAAPEEVVASPLTLYLAVVGTTFPAIDDLPAAFDPAWKKLGTEGALNYEEGGVSVSHGETKQPWTPAAATMPRKYFRTAETLGFKLGLTDIGPEAYAMVMNDATVTTVAAVVGTAGEKSFSLYRGDQINAFALLARGLSPVDNDLNMQYEMAHAFVSVNGDVVFDKGKPAFLPVEIDIAHTSDTDEMVYRVQTAAAPLS